MSFISILKTVGKDLSHVGSWIDDGLKIVAPVISVIDPPLGPVIMAIEAVFDNLPKSATLTPTFVQQIVTAIVALETTKMASAPPVVKLTPTMVQFLPDNPAGK
jgi:hypothetical protein